MTNSELKQVYVGGMSLLALAKSVGRSRDWVSVRLIAQGVKLRTKVGAPIQHGQSRSTIYTVWTSMIARTETPTHPAWDRYGGRGIKMCDRWRNSFQAFIDDMGPRPRGYYIDRIDNDQGYGPGNCRWVTPTTSTRNRSNATMIEVDGVTLQLNDACEKYGVVSYGTAKARLRMGWKPDVSVKTPPRRKRSSSN